MSKMYAGTHKRVLMYHSKNEEFHAPSLDLYNFSTDTALKRAITKKLKQEMKRQNLENRRAKEGEN